MYFKFISNVKQFGCVWILFCCLLSSVSHSTDTSEGAHELPFHSQADIPTPSIIPVIEDTRDQNTNSETQISDTSEVTSDSSEKSPQDPPPSNVGLSSSETEQRESELDDVKESKDETSQEDLLQLPTMDEFITQNKLKPDSAPQSTNGAANTESTTPISSTDSSQAPSNPPGNGKESKSNGQHQTPPKQKNYASADCGAKIVATNSESRNAGGILNENRDDYMLNKCSLEAMWVTVELCDYIQVQSIELSVYELFSSLPENFTISLSDRRGVTPENSTLFTAKNVRGVQTFRVPLAEQYHARFVRLSFLSHYGSEHYCPVTTLRVFGANVVEVLEAMESGSASQENESPPIAPSLSLEANDSGRGEVGERSSDGIISSALDGIYKLVWPEGDRMAAAHNVNASDGGKIVSLDLNGDVANDTYVPEDTKEPAKVGLKLDEGLQVDSMELSNDTASKLVERLNDSGLPLQDTNESPKNESNPLLDLDGGQNQTENKQEKISSPPKESGNISNDSSKAEVPDVSTRKVNLTNLSQTQENSESIASVEQAEKEAQENSTQHNPNTVPTPSNTMDNASTPDSVAPTSAPPTNTPPTSQNYLVRMQERIARLGENVTLIHRYLDQFRHSIQRNVNRTEEVQRSLDRKLSQLETHLNLTLLHGYLHDEDFEYAKSLCTESNASIVSHVQLIKSLFLAYFIFTILAFVLIGGGFLRYFKKQLRKELSFHSSQMNLELQKISNSLEDDRKRVAKKKSTLTRPFSIRNHENEDMDHHLTDHDVLSDSHVHTYAYSHRCVKKKKKTRKSPNFNIAYPY